MIETENLTKLFRVHRKKPGLVGSIQALFKRDYVEKAALKGVSLRINAGEIVGLVGANGAGKTTLVKLLSGIIHPSSGNAKVLGHTPWERKTDFRKQIALIMGQKAQLWWDLPAADCFLLLREIYQIPQEQFDVTLKDLVEKLDVKNQLNIQIRRLSLGERMKMELIAALVHQPKVVFLDEPTIGLDITSQRAIREFLLDYRKTHRPAMILTSHYMEDIETLCERIVVVREGEMVWDGPLHQIKEKYAREKVITAHILKDHTDAAKAYDFRGTVLERTADYIKVSVARDDVARVASHLLQNYPVRDLNIEEEDITRIIEALMRAKHQ